MGVTRSDRKNLITSKEKVVIHLLDYHKFRHDSAAPEEVTQDGIAEAIDVGRNNVSKVVRDLVKEDILTVQKKHVRGMKRIRKVYFLTHMGFQHGVSLKEEIESVGVTVVDFDQEETEDQVGRLNMYLPNSYSLIELASAVTRGTFDCPSFYESKKKEERRFVDYTDRKPTVREFFGREQELEKLEDFIEKDEANILSVFGIAGIGKTTLLAKFAQDVRSKIHVFWYKVHEWVTPKILLNPLAEFLSNIGKKGLERYLSQTDALSMGELCTILESDLKGVSSLIIIDDIQNAGEEVRGLLRALTSVMNNLPKLRLITASREMPEYYSRSDVISGHIEEIHLKGLERGSAIEMLRAKHHPGISIEDVFDATDGHPLFLQLVEDPQSILKKDVRMFIEQEVYSKLNMGEKHILEIACIFRYPVMMDAFFAMEEEIQEELGNSVEEMSYQDYMVDYETIDDLLTKSMLQESTGRMIGMHDLIREFFYSRLSPRQRRTYHRAASKYYLEDSSISSYVEALYHSLQAEEFDTAVQIAAGHGRQILKRGYTALFAPLVEELLSGHQEVMEKDKIELLLLLGNINEVRGEWDQALANLRRVIQIASEGEDTRLIAEAHRRIGAIYLRRVNFDESMFHLEKSLSLAQESEDVATLMEVLYDLGGNAERRGEMQEALSYFEHSRDLAKSIGNDVGLGKALYGMGRAHEQMREYKRSIRLKEEALEVLERTGNANEIAKVCTSLGIDLKEVGDMKWAIEYQDRAIDLAQEGGDVSTFGYALSNAAASYLEMGNVEKSEELIERASSIFENLKDKMMISTMHLYRGYAFSAKNEWNWAKEEFGTGLEIMRGLRVPVKLSTWLYEIGMLYLQNEDTSEGKSLLREALKIADETDHENLRREITDTISAVE